MSVLLRVPFHPQLRSAGGAVDDPTGCWYACACMVGGYFEVGPRLGVPELYTRQLGGGRVGHRMLIDAGNSGGTDYFRLLLQRERLVANGACADPLMFYDAELIAELLNAQGPILFMWTKPGRAGSFGHASVVVGADGDGVVYHDPEVAPGMRMTVDQFNRVRQRFRYGLLQRAAGTSPRVPR